MKRGQHDQTNPHGIARKAIIFRYLLPAVIIIAAAVATVWQTEDGAFTFRIALFGAQQRVNILLLAFTLCFSGFMVFRSRRTVARFSERMEKAKLAAGRDVLSGLPNRALFNDLVDAEVARCRRSGSQFALFYIDLDRFKETNDSFGHEAGDQLIVAVAERLAKTLRGSDYIARIGGDEFAVLQTGVRDPRDCAKLARRIIDKMSAPFDLMGQQFYGGLSIGIALYPQNGDDRVGLMRFADLALYRAKHEGRNRFAFFEDKNGEEIRLLQNAEDDLRAAIENDKLLLFYQPIVSACGKRLLGVEALVRWEHPEQGFLTAERFVGLAEERGLIVPLGEWVLRKACCDAKRWPGLYVAVNVSPIQFRQKDFVASVEAILAETGLEPQRLELELTEGVVISDADLAERSIMDLRALGVRMALDDFGCGYSSLIYLRRFAFDKIKIDRVFLESMEPQGESAIIVESIVHLGRALGLTVTAEGIETVEQAKFLHSIGCDELQGFLFAPPLAAAEIDRKYTQSIAGKPICSLEAVEYDWCHCEKQSDEAIQGVGRSWIASRSLSSGRPKAGPVGSQ
ncbi:MAG: EAL domain-containing protein [Beijerinckiaceae bacterium]|nr:MAG: EAL domain-containing protein [Beijerinckiaceae bacterium]